MSNSITNSINNTVGASNSGVTNTLTVTNPSDTANSAANVQVTVGGGTAGDPQTTYTVTGGSTWSFGIDNNSSDSLVISNNAALGTDNRIYVTTAGVISCTPTAINGPMLDVQVNGGNGFGEIRCINLDTGAAAHAGFTATANTGSAGDCVYKALITGGSEWSWGLDNSDADAYVVSSNNGLGINNTIRVAVSGEVTFPLTPAFLAYQASAALNVSGTGAAYTLGSTVDLTEVFDQNADFDPATGTFTAPVTGRYKLGAQVYWNGLTIATTFINNIVTTAQTFTNYIIRAASNGDESNLITVLCNMTAGDTCTFEGAVVGEAGATADCFGQAGSPRYTFCYGNLEC
jgi:hypothetical protein